MHKSGFEHKFNVPIIFDKQSYLFGKLNIQIWTVQTLLILTEINSDGQKGRPTWVSNQSMYMYVDMYSNKLYAYRNK
mgnify:CR=1 FL=1